MKILYWVDLLAMKWLEKRGFMEYLAELFWYEYDLSRGIQRNDKRPTYRPKVTGLSKNDSK